MAALAGSVGDAADDDPGDGDADPDDDQRCAEPLITPRRTHRPTESEMIFVRFDSAICCMCVDFFLSSLLLYTGKILYVQLRRFESEKTSFENECPRITHG